MTIFLNLKKAHLQIPSSQILLLTFLPLWFPVSSRAWNLHVSFPCSSVSGDQLYSLVWGCVHRLEACGFKVVALTCDGASANRKFLKLHKSSKELTYKTENPYANEDRPIFFVSDPPHLIKTVRNCWANSHSHSGTRNLWVSV